MAEVDTELRTPPSEVMNYHYANEVPPSSTDKNVSLIADLIEFV